MIDVTKHLDWLVGQIKRRGGRFVQADLGALGAVAGLHPRSSVAAIVNATGLGSAALAQDSSMYNDFDIISGPFFAHFSAPHHPHTRCGTVFYLVPRLTSR